MRRVEDELWWYRSLRSLVARELKRRLRTASPRILDAGCGTGASLVAWTRALHVPCSGIDLSSAALAHCRERGERRVAQASVEALPFGDAAFDAVVSLDVLCLDGVDESRSLVEFHRVLRTGGLLVLNLPAFESLRGEHDRAVRIRRRFERTDAEAMLRASGFTVSRVAYWNTLLFPAVWLVRRLRRGGTEATSDLAPVPAPLNLLLVALLRVEAVLFRVIRPPFGTSVLCVAMKPRTG